MAIPDQTFSGPGSFNYTVPANTFLDLDRDTLTFDAGTPSGFSGFAPLPAWLTINHSTGTFSGNPESLDASPLQIRVRATDPDGKYAYEDFQLTLNDVGDYINLDRTTGEIRVRGGAGDSNDILTLVPTQLGTYIIVNEQVSLFGPGLAITSISIDLGGGTNLINLKGTPAKIPVNIHGSGTDTLNIGSEFVGVQNVRGTVNIENEASGTTITIDDRANTSVYTTAHMGTVPFGEPGWGYIADLAPADIHYKYADSTSVTIHTSTADGDVFGVWENGVPTTVVTHGQAAVYVGGGDVGVDALLGHLTVKGNGNSTLTINDQQGTTGLPENLPADATNVQTSVSYGVTGQDVTRTTSFGYALPSGGGGGGVSNKTISYQAMAELELSGSNVSGAKPLVGSFSGDFDSTLSLTGFEVTALDVAGDFRGSLLASTIGTLAAPIEHIKIGGSLLTGSRIKVNYLDTLTVGGDLLGTVNGYGVVTDPNTEFTIGAVTVGGLLWGASGSITAPSIKSLNMIDELSVFGGKATELQPGADFQSVYLAGSMASTGTITAGMIVSMTVGADMAGEIIVAGDLGKLMVGGDLTGTVVAGSIGTLTVGGSMAGTVATTNNSSAIVHGTTGDDVFVIAPTFVSRNGAQILDRAFTTLTVNGLGDVDRMTINDQTASTGRYYEVTDTTVGAGPQGSITQTITYGSVEYLALNAGSGDDFVRVSGTSAATAVTVNAGAGGDDVFLGTAQNTLDQILRTVIVDGQDNGDRLVVQDDLSLDPHTYTVTSHSISRDGLIVASYFNVESLQVGAEGLLVQSSRGDRTSIELFSGPLRQ